MKRRPCATGAGLSCLRLSWRFSMPAPCTNCDDRLTGTGRQDRSSDGTSCHVLSRVSRIYRRANRVASVICLFDVNMCSREEMCILLPAQVEQDRIVCSHIGEPYSATGRHRSDQPTVGDQVERCRPLCFECTCRDKCRRNVLDRMMVANGGQYCSSLEIGVGDRYEVETRLRLSRAAGKTPLRPASRTLVAAPRPRRWRGRYRSLPSLRCG